jgi:hypothetical protein
MRWTGVLQKSRRSAALIFGATMSRPGTKLLGYGLIATAGIAAACTGELQSGNNVSGASGNAGSGVGSGPSGPSGRDVIPDAMDGECAAKVPDALPLRHLTRAQYESAVKEVLGVGQVDGIELFPPDETVEGFEIGRTISPLLAQQYLLTAERVAAAAVQQVPALAVCEGGRAEQECAIELAEQIGLRAYRRPVADGEAAELVKVFSVAREGANYSAGVAGLVQAVISSPHFFYHAERTLAEDGDTAVRATPFELASRLSFFLWSAPPDAELLDAAASGELDTIADVEKQARRMIDVATAKHGFQNFYRQWLGMDQFSDLQKDPERYPSFDKPAASAFRQALGAYIDEVMWNGDGTLESLLLDRTTFANDRIAALAGLPAPGGDDIRKIVLNESDDRRGLLGQPAFLALLAHPNQTDPVRRGKFVRTELLCGIVLPPPPEANVMVPEREPGISTRQRFEQHSVEPACKGCHEMMDPIGFGFEKFGPLGEPRDDDEGHAVDDSGAILGDVDVSGRFSGISELATRLSGSEEVGECVSRRLIRYSSAKLSPDSERCLAQTAADVARESGRLDLKELVVSITLQSAFSAKRVSSP